MSSEETLNEKFTINEIISLHKPKSSKKPKLAKAIITFLAITFVATFLIGLSKLNIPQKQINIHDKISFSEVIKSDPSYNVSASYYYSTLIILNKTIRITFKYGCFGETAFGYLILKTDEHEYKLGGEKSYKNLGIRRWYGELDLFTFPFEKIPGIDMTLILGGSVMMSTKFNENKELEVIVSCNLLAKAKVTSGFDKVNYITGGASGTILTGSLYGVLDSQTQSQHVDRNINPYRSFKLYVEGKDLQNKDFKYESNPPISIRY